MNAIELLTHLESLGVGVRADGERLRVSAERGQITNELKEAINALKPELLALLARRAQDATDSTQAYSTHAAPEGEFPVSFAQRRLWFLDQLSPGSSAYNLGASRLFESEIDVAALEQSINDVVQRQASLRTVFREAGGEPVQVVRPFERLRLELIDLSTLAPAETASEATRLARAEAARPFDLATGPLFRARLLRLEPRKHVLLFSLHHIICDGWSLGIFLDDLARCYEARRAGSTPWLAPLTLHYSECVKQERERLQANALDTLLAYWRERLAGAPPTLELPTDRPRPARQTSNGATVGLALSTELSDGLRALARRERATLYMALLAVFNVLLQRWSGQSDIVVGTPVANRPTSEHERLVGMFVSTLPIRSQVAADVSTRELIAQIRERVFEAQTHIDLPFDKLVDELRPERSLAWSPIFQVAFILQNMPTGTAYAITSVATTYDLSLFLWEGPTGIQGSFEYNTDLFDRSTIERMRDHFGKLATGMVDDPAMPVSRLPMLSEAERHRVVVDWNATESPYPRDASLPQCFAAAARAHAESIAIESTDASREPLPTARMTYDELARATDSMAVGLIVKGVRPGMPVGLYMERSLAAVAALIAIVKAGACYVPLDTADPSRRIAEILRNAEIRHVFTQRGLRANLPAHDIDAITIEELWSARADTDPPALADPIAPDSLAYIMFTSGTTGQPKGVCVTHRNVLRLVLDTNYVELGPREVLLQFAPLAFDASTLEIWGTLLNGGRLVVHPERVPTARDLAKVLRAHRISTLWLTAGFFHYMVENEVGTLAGVRQVLAGGDVLSVAHVQKLLDAKRDGVVVNGYGPTENTTFTCCHPMTPGTRLGNAVPIGRPIANTCVYILDAHGVPTPVGVAGELFAGGDGVARGYLGKPDATAERFLPDPFAQRAGATMYRTGDLARWRADGTIEFIGRRDRQVKVRGFRIELDEIETTLRACAPVRDAAVIARRDASGANTLVAYLVPGTGVTLDQKTIKQRLAERLPDYMVPGILMVLDDLPLTSNGKLDRSALPEPQAKESTLVVPRTMLEAQIHAIWERVLGRTDVGVHDNFFDLGGHSLLAVRLFAQIESVVGRRLPISVLFQAPTVAQLAARMEQEGFSAPWASLVAIQPEGAKAPLFLIPGIGGNVVCYGAMARELGSDQPLYALQSRGLDGRQPPFERIEPMAAHYVEEIRKVQPRGPYHLGGSCFGGVVAYEMAQQLRAAGEEVSRLFLLESWPPPEGRPFLRSLLVYANRVRFLYTLAMRNFVALAKLPMSQWHSAFRERIKVVTEIATTGDLYRGDSEAMYADRVSTANHRALLSYRPRRYSGALFSIIASRREFQGDDGRKRWRELSGQGYEQLEVPARDSGTLLESPHIEHVAAWIKRHLPIDAPTVNAAALPTDQHRPLESAAH